MTDRDRFLDGLPKAELHVHIEGTLEPEMMFALAGRNGVTLGHDSVDALRAAYSFGNLQDFLDLYYQGMSVLVAERDFYDLTLAYLARAHADGVRHAEIMFDPQGHTGRGVAFEAVLDGIEAACGEAATRWGLTTRLILCFLRHLPAADAMATLEAALPHRHRFTAVGLDSSEQGHPPGGFGEVFDRARAEGLLTVAHAGEEGPPAYVSEALDRLRVDRIDHGNRALEDAALVRRLARTRVPLTVCPLSNLRLCGVDRMENHPLREMMERGLMVTVNSDDPAYFGGYVNDNYRAVRDALGLGDDDLALLARNSIEASFLTPAERAPLLAEVDAWVAGRQA